MSLLLMPEARIGEMEGELHLLRSLLEAARYVFVLEETGRHGRDVKAVIAGGPWPWLASFDDDDLGEFVDEMTHGILAGITERDPSTVDETIAAWHESARAMADPERAAALVGSVDIGDYVEIAPE